MGQLTTHVLDTAQGIPARGVEIALHRVNESDQTEIGRSVTNDDGRLDRPLLADDAFVVGTYELVFNVGRYFASQTVNTTEPPFLDLVSIRFTVNDSESHFHIPLLVSPWAYSTYRGS